MKIDTLILSGGGINCLAFIGTLKFFFETNQIKKNFKNIKKIICVSGGLFVIIPFLLNLSIESVIKIVLNYKEDILVDKDKFKINDILVDYGLFKNPCSKIVKIILKQNNLSEDINLKEFFEYTNINLTVKVVNLSKALIEYINYKNYPELPLHILCDMTSGIPGIFKPVIYKKQYYVDGAICGNFPLENNKSKNYLGINVDHNFDDITDINDIGGYIKSLWNMIGRENTLNKKRIINIKIKMMGTNFDVTDEERKKIIKDGYFQTKNHFKLYS